MHKKFIGLALGMAVTGSVSFSALAYAPQWLECSGEQAITSASGTTKQAVTDVYVYDPDAQNLFKYSDAQKRLSYLGAKAVAPQTLQWSGSGGNIERSEWEGKFDRNAMSLKLSYKSGPETRVWSETCKATEPKPES